MTLEFGMVTGGYRIEGVLGRGGMGVVYAARQLSLDRMVALKVLSPALSDDEEFRERFRREGRIQAAIDHPHIVTVHEAGELEDGLFLAMRLIHGPTLKELVTTEDLTPTRALQLLAPIADALDSAHAVGLVHRDVKPQNILVGAREHPFLADFGLTKSADSVGLTKTGQVVGTMDYISPEQIRGEDASPSSDTYSLAAVLVQCLTGAVPFPRDSDAAALYAHLLEPPPRVTERRHELPPALDAVVAAGMAKDPVDRPATATELIEAARRALEEATADAGQPSGAGSAGVVEPEKVAATRAPAPAPAAPSAHGAGTVAPASLAPGTFAPATPAPITVQSEPAPSAPAPGAPGSAAPPPSPVAAGPPAAHPTKRAARSTRRARRFGVLTAIALAIAVVTGVLLTQGSDDSSEAEGPTAPAAPAADALTGSVANADVALRFPGGWRPSHDVQPIPGLAFADGLALESAGGDRILLAGRTAGEGPTLLPRAFRAELADAPAAGERVQLGQLEALRYRGLRVTGFSSPLTVYAVPTDEGVTSVACSGTTSFEQECARVAATLDPLRGKPLPLGPDAAYARALDTALTRLNRDHLRERGRLRRARTAAGQARAAAAAASAFQAATRRVAALAPGPVEAPVTRQIAAALRGGGDAYGVLASAARRRDAGDYDRGRRAVTQAEATVRRRLAALEPLGYRIE